MVANNSPWLRLSADIFQNPKIEALSPPAKLVYIAGLCEAKRAGAGGLIAASSVTRLVTSALGDLEEWRKWRAYPGELLEAGLWEQIDAAGEAVTIEHSAKPPRNLLESSAKRSRTFRESIANGTVFFRVHDWSDYQQSETEIEEKRRTNAERQAALRERRRAQRSLPEPTDNALHNAVVTLPTKTITKTITSNVTDIETESSNEISGRDEIAPAISTQAPEVIAEPSEEKAPEPEKPKRPGRQRSELTAMSTDWQPPEGFEKYAAAECGIVGADYELELAKYRDHFRHTGEKRADWVAGFRNWLRREQAARQRFGFKPGQGIAKSRVGPQNGRAYKTSTERLEEIAAGK